MAYEDFKYLPRRTTSDEILHDKAFNIAKNRKYDGCQRGIASIVYKFLDKNSAGSGIKNKIKQNEQLAEELHKVTIRKFAEQKYTNLLNTIFGVLILQIYNE